MQTEGLPRGDRMFTYSHLVHSLWVFLRIILFIALSLVWGALSWLNMIGCRQKRGRVQRCRRDCKWFVDLYRDNILNDYKNQDWFHSPRIDIGDEYQSRVGKLHSPKGIGPLVPLTLLWESIHQYIDYTHHNLSWPAGHISNNVSLRNLSDLKLLIRYGREL